MSSVSSCTVSLPRVLSDLSVVVSLPQTVERYVSPVTVKAQSGFSCPEPDGVFAHSGQCDKYYQCTDGVAEEKLCQDGLLFHPDRPYPCVYPQEVECLTRSAVRKYTRKGRSAPTSRTLLAGLTLYINLVCRGVNF